MPILQIVRPETLVRWHRAGLRSYWRWKSRNRGGRPQIHTDLRALIVREFEKLAMDARRAPEWVIQAHPEWHVGPPGQSWRTFLRSHMPESRRWTCSWC